MKKQLKGSYSVEASMVMIIVISVLLAMFYLAFYIHDAVLIEAVLKDAAEQARYLGEGCSLEELEKEAVRKAAPRLCIGGLQISVSRKQKTVMARAEGRICFPAWPAGGHLPAVWEHREEQNTMRPQDYIRKDRGRRAWSPGIRGN